VADAVAPGVRRQHVRFVSMHPTGRSPSFMAGRRSGPSGRVRAFQRTLRSCGRTSAAVRWIATPQCDPSRAVARIWMHRRRSGRFPRRRCGTARRGHLPRPPLSVGPRGPVRSPPIGDRHLRRGGRSADPDEPRTRPEPVPATPLRHEPTCDEGIPAETGPCGWRASAWPGLADGGPSTRLVRSRGVTRSIADGDTERSTWNRPRHQRTRARRPGP
jgi:hypothetical protein